MAPPLARSTVQLICDMSDEPVSRIARTVKCSRKVVYYI